MLNGLLRTSGLDPKDLTAATGDPAFLAGVLDFLMQDDDRLLRFCETHDLTHRHVHMAARALGGNGADA